MQHIEEIIEDFSLFSDWEERYGYIIDMGRNLKPMDVSQKNDENFVPGCTSQVWMVVDIDQQGHITLTADSDALIVKGLIGILVRIYEGQSIETASQIDVEDVFARLGLSEHLSPNRRNGFFAMAQKIKAYSEAA